MNDLNPRGTLVKCRLADCMYYRPGPPGSAEIVCVHVEKPHYMNVDRCPLYHVDWQRNAALAEQLARRLRR